MCEQLKTLSQSLLTARDAAASVMGSEQFENPFELLWRQQSRLVALLCDGTVQNLGADGWACLAAAGQIARAQEADAMVNMKTRDAHATVKRLRIAADCCKSIRCG